MKRNGKDKQRNFGSIGLFIDAGGKDTYSEPGRDNSIWIGKKYGVGVDGEGKVRWLVGE